MSYPALAVTVDLVVLTVRDDALCVLLVRRGEPPFEGQWALPGGFVRADEDLDGAAQRELLEETGVRSAQLHVEQLASYGRPDRDPRLRTVTVAYLALGFDLPEPKAGSDAAEARFAPVADARGLAFDHDAILADGLARARAKLEYAPIATALCPEEFTVAEFRRVYEAVWDVVLDPRNFHRKVTGVPGLLLPTGRTTTRNGGRPAELYRRGPARYLSPPMLRG